MIFSSLPVNLRNLHSGRRKVLCAIVMAGMGTTSRSVLSSFTSRVILYTQIHPLPGLSPGVPASKPQWCSSSKEIRKGDSRSGWERKWNFCQDSRCRDYGSAWLWITNFYSSGVFSCWTLAWFSSWQLGNVSGCGECWWQQPEILWCCDIGFRTFAFGFFVCFNSFLGD